jgi:hypothetical protein
MHSVAFGIWLVVLVVLASATAHADDAGLDPARYNAATARAAQHWKTGGYDVLPPTFTAGIIERDKESSVIAHLADELMQRNPGKASAVLDYINSTVVPFVAAHRAQLECYLAEDYYNQASIPTEQLANFNESPLSYALDASFLLIGTEKARQDAGVALPDNESLLSAMAYARESGWTNPHNKTHFHCAA